VEKANKIHPKNGHAERSRSISPASFQQYGQLALLSAVNQYFITKKRYAARSKKSRSRR